jgi:hypothetical protein
MVWEDIKGRDWQLLCSLEDRRLSMLPVNPSYCPEIFLNNIGPFEVGVNSLARLRLNNLD